MRAAPQTSLVSLLVAARTWPKVSLWPWTGIRAAPRFSDGGIPYGARAQSSAALYAVSPRYGTVHLIREFTVVHFGARPAANKHQPFLRRVVRLSLMSIPIVLADSERLLTWSMKARSFGSM